MYEKIRIFMMFKMKIDSKAELDSVKKHFDGSDFKIVDNQDEKSIQIEKEISKRYPGEIVVEFKEGYEQNKKTLERYANEVAVEPKKWKILDGKAYFEDRERRSAEYDLTEGSYPTMKVERLGERIKSLLDNNENMEDVKMIISREEKLEWEDMVKTEASKYDIRRILIEKYFYKDTEKLVEISIVQEDIKYETSYMGYRVKYQKGLGVHDDIVNGYEADFKEKTIKIYTYSEWSETGEDDKVIVFKDVFTYQFSGERVGSILFGIYEESLESEYIRGAIEEVRKKMWVGEYTDYIEHMKKIKKNGYTGYYIDTSTGFRGRVIAKDCMVNYLE